MFIKESTYEEGVRRYNVDQGECIEEGVEHYNVDQGECIEEGRRGSIMFKSSLLKIIEALSFLIFENISSTSASGFSFSSEQIKHTYYNKCCSMSSLYSQRMFTLSSVDKKQGIWIRRFKSKTWQLWFKRWLR